MAKYGNCPKCNDSFSLSIIVRADGVVMLKCYSCGWFAMRSRDLSEQETQFFGKLILDMLKSVEEEGLV